VETPSREMKTTSTALTGEIRASAIVCHAAVLNARHLRYMFGAACFHSGSDYRDGTFNASNYCESFQVAHFLHSAVTCCCWLVGCHKLLSPMY
jgi:hypothetical protein